MRLLFLLKARKAYYKDKSGRVFRWDAGRKRYIYVRKGRHAHIKPEEIKRRERIKKENIHDRLRYERRTRSKFVGRVVDGPAYEAIDQPYEKIQIGRAHSTQLPKYQYVSKDLRRILKDHQEDFINLAMQKFDEGQKGVMCGDGTGSGKSMQELALAETFMEHDPSARVIIVTESDRIISESLAKDGKMLGIGMALVKKETDEVKDSGIYVTRYSDLAALKDKLAWSDLVIFDESHNMKNKMSSKTKAGIDLIGSSKHSAVFTATPIDRPMHIEYLCKMYGLDFSKVMKFVGFQRLQYGWNTNQSAVVIAERLDSIFQTLSEKGLFVRREVPLEGLDVTMKTVKMSASHEYWYESTVDKLREEVEKASDKDRGLTKARWLMRARAVLEEAKIKEALTSIDDAIKKDRQVVLFATRVNETTLSREEAPSLRKSPHRKLTRYQVAEIRSALQRGVKGKDLAEQYNINFRTISDIKVGKTWKHIIPQEAATSADRVKFTSGTLKTLQKELTKRGISFASVFGSSRHAVNDIKKFQKGDVKVMLTTPDSGGPQPLYAKILTPIGWITMGEVKVGDKIVAIDGTATTVVEVYEQGKKDIYEIVTKSGTKARCSLDHLWTVRSCTYRGQRDGWQTYSLEELLRRKRLSDYRLPVNDPVEMVAQDVSIEPYFLGLLLGDGTFRRSSPGFCSGDGELLLKAKKAALRMGLSFIYDTKTETYLSGAFSSGALRNNSLTNSLRDLSLWKKSGDEKFVPDVYKVNSIDVRLAILRGLMDTDGTVGKEGDNVHFCTVSLRLAEDVVYLARSLGGVANIREQKFHWRSKAKRLFYYNVSIGMSINPFSLQRKAIRWARHPHQIKKNNLMHIKKVGREQCRCILIDHPSQLYITDDFIVTHNTGLSLDDKTGNAPRTTVMMTPPFSAMSYVQMLGRIHRIDTKSDSEVVMINTDTMVDQWNKGIIANKLTALGGVVKGDYEKMDLHDLEVTETLSPEDAAEYMSKRKGRGSIPYSSSTKFDFDAHKKGLKKSLSRLREVRELLKSGLK